MCTSIRVDLTLDKRASAFSYANTSLTFKNSTFEYRENGMDLAYYYPSAEWDLLRLNATRNEQLYGSCCGTVAYVDVRFCFVTSCQ